MFAVSEKRKELVKEILAPKFLSSGGEGDVKDLKKCTPSLTWGYGHSPVLKDKCYATLVVAWGPLIQLYVLNDLGDAN